VQGEHRLAVPPLAVPDLAALPPAEELSQFAAIALFVQRAREVRPTFTLTATQAPAVAAICHRLDGLPLAIELAAAWVRLAAPSTLLRRLERRLPLLMAGARDLPERQQTLRAAIDWSHDLLAPGEQRLLRRLAVFVGGWTLEAAEAVCGEAGEEMFPVLATLVDISLVDRHEEASDGEVRFRLLELVREYALERLEASGEAEAIRERHARYYLGFAMPASRGSEIDSWVARLARDNDNLRTALTWAQLHDILAGMDAAALLFFYWSSRSMLQEGRRWLEAFLELPATVAGNMPPMLRARVLTTLGSLAFDQGDYARSTACYEEALAVFQAAKQRRGVTSIVCNQAVVAVEQGQFARAATLLQECLAARTELGHGLGEALAAEHRGIPGSLVWQAALDDVMLADTTDLAEAATAIAHLAEVNRQSTAMNYYTMARLALAQGDLALAQQHCEQSCRMFGDLGCTLNVAQARSMLGEVAARQGDLWRARELLKQVVPLFRAEEAKWDLAAALNRVGWLAQAQGDIARAEALYRESLELYQEIGNRRGVAETLEYLGIALALKGRQESAVRLLGKGAALREAIGSPAFPVSLTAIEGAITNLRAALGERRFSAIWEVASTQPLEQVLAFEAL
jgi:tetratricopeptide (TPR) repeat protein